MRMQDLSMKAGREVPHADIERVLEMVGHEIVREGPRLRFGAELETLFEQQTGVLRAWQTFAAGIIALLLFNALLMLDYTGRPEVFEQALLLRLVVVTIPSIGVLIWILQRPTPMIRDLALALCILLTTLASNIMNWNTTSLLGHYNAFGFSLIVIAANTALGIRFLTATVTSIVCVALTAAFLLHMPQLNSSEMYLPLYYMAAMAAITLVGNYRLEKSMRDSYLLLLREKLQSHQIRHRNAELSLISYTDPLTGIANRRRFDEELAKAWAEAARSGEILALLMIDIDFFKRYNDAFGHPAGDSCLERVATAISSQTRETVDMPARLGGEEFAVILRHADASRAQIAADRIHRAIREMAIPHEHGDSSGYVTISIGAASASPNDGGSRDALIKQADVALYQAKNRGKNQTFEAEPCQAA
jgi:diguanylate cyclase (GGDEF)-like protein